jgi:hypothetical protein
MDNDDKKDLEPILLKSMTNRDLEFWGLDEFAFIKPVVEQGQDVVGIFSADGRQIGYGPDRDVAIAMTIQNDLFPLSVH